MKFIFTIIFIDMLISVIILPVKIFAYNDTLVVYASKYSLNYTVAGDTLANGEHDHKVYKLVSRDTTYKFDGPIIDKSSITIVGELDPVTGRPPCIQPTEKAVNSTSNICFEFIGKGTSCTLKNLYLLGISENNVINYTSGQAVQISDDSIRFIADNVVFEQWSQYAIGYNGKWDKLYITNCKFRNLISTPGNYYNGQAIRNEYIESTIPTDSIVIKYSTLIGIGAYITANTGGILNYYECSHVSAIGMFKNPFFLDRVVNAKFDNNIFYNVYAGGQNKSEYNGWDSFTPKTGPSLITFGLLDSAIASILLGHAATGPGDPAAEELRNIEVKNNVYYWSNSMRSAWTMWNDTATVDNYIYIPEFMNDTTQYMFNTPSKWPALTSSGNQNIDPGFGPSIDNMLNSNSGGNVGLLIWFKLVRTGTGSTEHWGYNLTQVDNNTGNWIPTWPLQESNDMQYSNAALKNGGTDGKPIGDPNWFPASSNDSAIVITSSATNITQTTAIVNGFVNPNGLSTTVEFEYGPTISYGNTVTASQSPVNGSSNVNVSANLTGLTPNTTYHYRIKATNNAGTSYSADSTFTTLQEYQSVTLKHGNSFDFDTKIVGDHTGGEFYVLLDNPKFYTNNIPQRGVFHLSNIGNKTLYDFTPPDSEYYNWKTDIIVDEVYSFLGKVGAKFDYYLVRVLSLTDSSVTIEYIGKNKVSTGNSISLTIAAAENITSTKAVLEGIVNPNGLSASIQFEYGKTISYGNIVDATPSYLDGNESWAVHADISGLNPKTLYHYRLKVISNNIENYSNDATFTTLSNPVATTSAATNITQNSATLNGRINSQGMSTTVEFEYGLTTSYGNIAFASQSPVNDSINVNVSANLTGLTPNTTFHYRIKATNIDGTSYSADSTFTTLSSAYTDSSYTRVTFRFTYQPNGTNNFIGTTDTGTITLWGSKSIQDRLLNSTLCGYLFGSHTITSSDADIYFLSDLSYINEFWSNNGNGGIHNFGAIDYDTLSSIQLMTNNGFYNQGGIKAIIGNVYGLVTKDGVHYAKFKVLQIDTVLFAGVSNQASVITGTVTNITNVTATLNGTVNPNGESTIVEFEYGLTTSYGNTATVSQNPVNGNSIINLSVNLSGLTSNTNYHYRIKATNTAGTSYGYDSTFKTTANKPIVTTEITTNTAQKTATLNGTVNPNGVSTIVEFEYGLTTSYGNTATASQSPVNGNSIVNVSVNLSGLTPNTNYHYRIKATNSGGTSTSTDNIFKTGYYYPTSITLSQNYTFSDYSKSSSYKLIGLPGNINNSLTQIFGGTPKDDWDAYYDDGNTDGNFIHFDNSNTFTFLPGNGFWIISDKTLNVSKNISTVILSSGSYSIPLHSGWNIISNPFDKSVVWDSVISANELASNQKIYSWNPGWTPTPSIFYPYEAYYFINISNLSSLKIQYDPDGTLNKKANKIASFIPEPDSSSLMLSLNLENKLKSYVIISIDSTSNDDYDQLDILVPPDNFVDVGMHLFNSKLSIDYKNLMKESRSMEGDGQAFNIAVKNTPKQKLTLKVDGIQNFNGSEIYLMDYYYHQLYNIKKNNNIMLSPVKQSNYELLIGTSDFIKLKEKEILPSEYRLFQNYPNPFNPLTTIEYSIPTESFVTLKVYDILGREITTLVNEQKNAGYYRIAFNAGNLSSGVYFYRIQAGNFTSTKKFILMK